MSYNPADYWNLTLEADLDKLAAALSTNPRFDALATGVNDILSAQLVYFAGFKAIQEGVIGPDAVLAVVRSWVQTVPRARSGGIGAGVAASTLCSILEDFIVDWGTQVIDTAVIARLRAPRGLPADDGEAKKTLIQKAKPSVKADGKKWLRVLDDVFGARPQQAVMDALLDMISFRNAFVHAPSEAYMAPMTGDQVKCWALATLIVARDIAP
jgi:hypothetical protein